MKRFLVITLFIILISGLLMGGCAKQAPAPAPATTPPAPATTTPATTAPVPQSGGILKLGLLTTQVIAPGYPPKMTTDLDYTHSSSCLETLIRWDEKFQLTPRLATQWTVAPDLKSITLTLRKGVKFHDGSDFNAEVAKWNLDSYRNSPKAELKSVSSVDVVDDSTIRLNLSAYDSLLTTSLTGDAGVMVSKKAFDANGQAWCESHPVGTGPFKFVSWMKDVSMKYERFDQYWGGKPFLDGVEVVQYADDTAAYLAFKRGEVDILHVRLDKNANELEATGYKVVRSPSGPLTWLAGDSTHANSPFANIKVRQAMSHALDLATMSKTLSGSIWQPINQWGASNMPVYNPNVVGYPYNPQKAKQLLTEAGYANGIKTKLTYCTIPMFDTMIVAIQGYLKEVGIDTELEPLQIAKFSEINMGKGWETGICHCLTTSGPDLVQRMVSIISGNRYPTMARPPGYNDLFAKALQATDEKTKNSLAQQMNKMATDDFCMCTFLWQQQGLQAKQSYVRDDMWGEVPNAYLSPKTWLSKK